MGALDLLIPKEKIFGLDIQETRIRAVFLRSAREKVALASFKEVGLEKGIIVQGEVKDKKAFALALKTIRRSMRTPYCVVSLPESHVFARVFQFPPIASEALGEAIKSDPSLYPYALDKSYTDWQEVKALVQKGKKELLIAQAKKNKVDSYLEALSLAGLIPVALESSSLSLARALEKPPQGASVNLLITEDGVTSLVLEGNDLRFARYLSFEEEMPQTKKVDILSPQVKDILVNEINRVMNYYHSQRKAEISFSSILISAEGSKVQKLAQYLTKETAIKTSPAKMSLTVRRMDLLKEDSLWLTALGCALRGLIPREEDAIISLLPVGTEEAYGTKRQVAFASLWGTVITTLAVVLIGVFFGTWFLLRYLVQTTDYQLAARASLPISEEASNLEEKALEFNQTVGTMKELQKDIYPFSPVLVEIKKIVNGGITLDKIDIALKENKVTINGRATRRTDLITLKDNLEKSNLFENTKMPLAGIEQKENIRFSISFVYKKDALSKK